MQWPDLLCQGAALLSERSLGRVILFLFFQVFSQLLVEVIFSLLFVLMMRTGIFRSICFVPRSCNTGNVPFDRIAPSSRCCGSGTFRSLEREEPEDPSAERADPAFSRPAVKEEKLPVFIEYDLPYERHGTESLSCS